MYLNSCHLDKQKVSIKINCFLFLLCLKAAPMTSVGCFDSALPKWKCALAALASWSSPFPPKKKYSLCYASSMKPQSLKVTQRGGLGGLEWRQRTFPSVQPSQDQPRLCVVRMLPPPCRWDLKGSRRFGGCLHLLKFPAHFYVDVRPPGRRGRVARPQHLQGSVFCTLK